MHDNKNFKLADFRVKITKLSFQGVERMLRCWRIFYCTDLEIDVTAYWILTFLYIDKGAEGRGWGAEGEVAVQI